MSAGMDRHGEFISTPTIAVGVFYLTFTKYPAKLRTESLPGVPVLTNHTSPTLNSYCEDGRILSDLSSGKRLLSTASVAASFCKQAKPSTG